MKISASTLQRIERMILVDSLKVCNWFSWLLVAVVIRRLILTLLLQLFRVVTNNYFVEQSGTCVVIRTCSVTSDGTCNSFLFDHYFLAWVVTAIVTTLLTKTLSYQRRDTDTQYKKQLCLNRVYTLQRVKHADHTTNVYAS